MITNTQLVSNCYYSYNPAYKRGIDLSVMTLRLLQEQLPHTFTCLFFLHSTSKNYHPTVFQWVEQTLAGLSSFHIPTLWWQHWVWHTCSISAHKNLRFIQLSFSLTPPHKFTLTFLFSAKIKLISLCHSRPPKKKEDAEISSLAPQSLPCVLLWDVQKYTKTSTNILYPHIQTTSLLLYRCFLPLSFLSNFSAPVSVFNITFLWMLKQIKRRGEYSFLVVKITKSKNILINQWSFYKKISVLSCNQEL